MAKPIKVVAVGVAALALTPLLVPVLAGVGRPLARAAVKTGLVLAEKGREVAAEMGEVLDDLAAEARAELARESAERAEAAGQAWVEEPGEEERA